MLSLYIHEVMGKGSTGIVCIELLHCCFMSLLQLVLTKKGPTYICTLPTDSGPLYEGSVLLRFWASYACTVTRLASKNFLTTGTGIW